MDENEVANDERFEDF